MKVVSVVGARPQFVKLAPIAHEMARRAVHHEIVHTGQHYDPMLSDVFFRDLGIPEPRAHLDVGSDTHGRQTAAMLSGLETIFEESQPDWVLVYGDTNSTIAGALAAAKMHIPVAHLEAGLRSFNRRMPEEHNRVLTDHASDLLLAPTATAMANLANEGLAPRAVLVGDVMVDVLLSIQRRAPTSDIISRLGLPAGEYSVATIHRAENTDDPARLRAIVSTLGEVGHDVILLAHPRLRAKADEYGIELRQNRLRPRDPLNYPDLVAAVSFARSVITDSGGLQKEAFVLRTPCTTVRTETEWIETVDLGWNVLVEPGPSLVAAVNRPHPAHTDAAPYGSGHAAEHVVDALLV